MTQSSSNNLIRNLLIFGGVFLVMLIVAGVIIQGLTSASQEQTRQLLLGQSAIQNIICFIGTALATSYIISKKPYKYLGISADVDWKPFVGVIIIWLISIPALNQLIYYNSIISMPDSLSALDKWMREMEELNGAITQRLLNTHTVGGLLSGIALIGVLTGLGEELLFRGVLQKILTNSGFGQWGIWIAAFIFSAVHLQFLGFFPRLLLGAFFGYLFYTTGSIWPGVFAHSLNNSLVVFISWINLNYPQYKIVEDIGACEEGFPITAFLSLIAVIQFFVFCYKYFFHGFNQKGN